MGLSDTATLIVDLIMKDGVTGPAKTATGGLKGFGATLLGVAGAAGFGALTAGALAAESAQGKFMAATGGSREEAKAFVSSMDGLAGSAGAVGRSFDEITAAGTMVAQQFGTTGQETADLTENILEFAKVTGQDATQAAGDLEDTLSAFGLEAGDASGLMDELVASSQRFGTDAGPAAIDALRNMAPALTAMNEGVDYGVAALNLFEVAGLDAATGQIAFNKALDDIPPGGNFDDIIAKLGAIEDPAARAAAAVEIFGAKAGPKMALAIKPGMTSLDDFAISAGDAADSVSDAASDMMTTSDKFKAVFDKIGAGARELGQAFGPAVTGIASIASLGAPLAKSFGTLIKDLAAKILPAAVATGTATGAAQGEAQAVAATGPSVISSMFAKISAMAIPLAPAGMTVGTAIGGAMTIGIIGALALGAGLIVEQIGIQLRGAGVDQGIGDAILGGGTYARAAADFYAKTVTEGLAAGLSSEEAKAKAANAIRILFGPQFVDAAAAGGAAAGTVIGTETAASMGRVLTTEGLSAVTGFFMAATPAATAGGTSTGIVAGEAINDGVAQGLTGGMSPADAFRAKLRGYGQTMESDAHDVGLDAGHALAMGLNDSLPSVHDQWRQYVTDSKNALNPLHEITWLEGKLSGHKLAEGLASNNPLTRARAEEMRDGMQAELAQLKTLMGQDATQASAALANNLDGDAAAAKAHAIMQRIENAFHDVKVGVSVGNYGGEHDYSGGGRAEGGPVWRGRAYIVGEHRPEVFVPNENGTIIPSIERFAGGGGFGGAGGGGFGGAPQSLALTVQVNLSSREVTEGQKHYAVVQAGGPAFR